MLLNVCFRGMIILEQPTTDQPGHSPVVVVEGVVVGTQVVAVEGVVVGMVVEDPSHPSKLFLT